MQEDRQKTLGIQSGMEILLSQWDKQPDTCQTERQTEKKVTLSESKSERIDRSPSETPLRQKNSKSTGSEMEEKKKETNHSKPARKGERARQKQALSKLQLLQKGNICHS